MQFPVLSLFIREFLTQRRVSRKTAPSRHRFFIFFGGRCDAKSSRQLVGAQATGIEEMRPILFFCREPAGILSRSDASSYQELSSKTTKERSASE
jgi:hypothetical protein